MPEALGRLAWSQGSPPRPLWPTVLSGPGGVGAWLEVQPKPWAQVASGDGRVPTASLTRRPRRGLMTWPSPPRLGAPWTAVLELGWEPAVAVGTTGCCGVWWGQAAGLGAGEQVGVVQASRGGWAVTWDKTPPVATRLLWDPGRETRQGRASPHAPGLACQSVKLSVRGGQACRAGLWVRNRRTGPRCVPAPGQTTSRVQSLLNG